MGWESAMTSSTMTGLGAALVAALVGTTPAMAQDQDRPFRSMSVDEDDEAHCEVPRIPVEFASTGGETDAYRYWLQKLELERRLETGECDCQVDEITWEEVQRFAEPWLTGYLDDPVIKRREISAEIEALQARLLMECAD